MSKRKRKIKTVVDPWFEEMVKNSNRKAEQSKKEPRKMKKVAADKIIMAVTNLKLLLMKSITKRPATYHATDVLQKIAGWELASLKDASIDLSKKVKQIYQEEVDRM